MKIHKHILHVESRTQIDFMDITDQVQDIVDQSGIREGQVLVYVPHTTMSVAINHNEPMLIQDLTRVLYKLAPVDDHYTHDLFELRKESMSDGRSNGHSHCKAFILGSSETIPVEKGRLFLGDRQNIFAIDFDGARKRDIFVQVMGM